MNPPPRCSRCGAAFQGGAQGWGGLCPACLLEFGWQGYPEDEQPPAPPESASGPERDAARFGGYERLDRIGSGGMGVVHRALQISLNRVVALKTLREELSSDAAHVHRFRSEAETAARLQHPHIVAIHEVGTHAGRPFFAMEFVEGRSLAEVARDNPMPPARAAGLLRTVAQAVHHAHACGVLHRDLKPSNVMLDPRGEPRILDFGLAKVASTDPGSTLPGSVVGSPSYMPPEQALGHPTDARGDVYALGAILYELLTSRAPFRADTAQETLRLVREEEAVPPRVLVPRIPRDLETICLHCLAKDPADRYPTAQALAEDLERFLAHEPIRARPAGAPTRLWRWSCRHPATAALASALALAIAAGFAGVTYEWRREFRQRLRAERSETEARQNLYAADMSLAQQAFDQANFAQARLLLARHAHEPRPGDRSPSPNSNGNVTTTAAATSGFEWRYLWHATRPDPHRILQGHNGNTCALLVSPDGRTLYSTAFDGSVRAQPLTSDGPDAWNLQLDFHASGLALQPSGNSLAVGGDPTANGVLLDRITRRSQALSHGGAVQPVTFSPDGRWLLKGSMEGWISGNGTLALMDSEGHDIATLPEAGGHALFSPDGRTLVTGSWQNTVRIWDWPGTPAAGVPVPALSGILAPAGNVLVLAVSPSGSNLATANSQGELVLWDLTRRVEITRSPRSRTGQIMSLAWSPDGRQLASGSEDRLLRVWDARTLELQWITRGHAGPIWAVTWTADGQHLLSAGEHGAIRMWAATAPPPRETTLTNVFADFQFSALTFSHDSRWIAASLRDGAIALWDIRSGQERARTQIGTPRTHAAFSSDNLELVVACGHSEVRRFRVPDLVESSHVPLESLALPATALALSEDGAQLVATQENPPSPTRLVLWDTRTGTLAGTLTGHTGRVMVARFAPEGTRLASGGFDRTVHLWDLPAHRAIHVLRGPTHAVTTLSFHPEGDSLVAGSWDGHLHRWRLSDGAPRPVPKFDDGVAVPEFIPGSGQLAVMTQATGVRLVDLDLQRTMGVLRRPGARPYRYLRCAPDGESLAVQTEEGLVHVWRAPTSQDSGPTSQIVP